MEERVSADPWSALCRDRACIGCGANDGTIVPAHSNQQAHGKGLGIKAESWTLVPLCHKCHTWLDNGSADRAVLRATWAQWWSLHMMSLCQAGLIGPVDSVPRVTARRVKKREAAPYRKPEKMLEHPGNIGR
jgi:hypothetical protein